MRMAARDDWRVLAAMTRRICPDTPGDSPTVSEAPQVAMAVQLNASAGCLASS